MWHLIEAITWQTMVWYQAGGHLLDNEGIKQYYIGWMIEKGWY